MANWFTDFFKKNKQEQVVQDLRKAEYQFGYDAVSVSMLLGSGRRAARNRIAIYEKLHFMMGDPIISAALKLHVTNALGGDPLTGNKVFIEPVPGIGDKKAGQKVVDEINQDCLELFNKIAFSIAYNAAGFGDSYARAYTKDKVGIVDIYTDEMVWPPLVQPYEKGRNTVGYTVAMGQQFVERLTIKQMVRMKMPRTGYVAQNNVVEKAVQTSLVEDDIEKLPYVPSLVGGSFLLESEEPYDHLQTALFGMVNQRILSSIDESMLSYNTDGMTKDQKEKFKKNLTEMLQKSKARVAEAIRTGETSYERFFHIIPVNGEKQLTQLQQFQGVSGSQSYNIEDVMFHLKRLAGSIGIDISMLGWADILAGGLGEGGFFRTSAQAAEISMRIRNALADFFYDLLDIHCYTKYGNVFDKKDRPYKINFYGSISALEGEKASSKERAMNGTMLMGQALGTLKDLGLKKDTLKQIMTTEMQVEQELAEKISKDMEAAPDDAGGGFGGGGFGGGQEPIDVDGSGDAEGGGDTQDNEVK